jgi:hypothetical protein
MKFISPPLLASIGLAIFLSACGDGGGGPVDECATAKDDCADTAACADTEASFTCTCAAGFAGDGKTSGSGCANIDECAAGTADCASGATCADNAGSFTCLCAAGFTGDGKTGGSGCADVNECNAAIAACDSAATCANTEGSFQCRGLYAPSAFQNHVYRLDPITLQALETIDPVLTGETVTGATAFAEDPTDHALYAVIKVAGGRSLARLDAMTATYTTVAPLSDRFSSITFDSAGQLFGVTGNGATVPETLYKLDKATGEATLVRALGAGADGEVISYNPDDGKIYHWSGGTSFFEAITMTEPYDIISLSSTFNREVFGAMWDAEEHNFLIFDISSAARRFFVDGTFSTTDLVSFPDDLRSPGTSPALPHLVTPSSGALAGGTLITLEGSGFTALATQLGATPPTVSFGAVTAEGTIVDDHHLTVTVPAGAGAGAVDVSISLGSYRYLWRAGFTYDAAP